MFNAGDYLYSKDDENLYHICRIICIEEELDVAHVSIYNAPSDFDPTTTKPESLTSTIMYAPIMASSLKNDIVFAHRPLSYNDVQGFFEILNEYDFKRDIVIARRPLAYNDVQGFLEFLKEHDFQRYVEEVSKYFSDENRGERANSALELACELSDKGDFKAAAEKCREAYTLWPLAASAMIAEAICFMDMEKYEEALEALKRSVDIRAPNACVMTLIGKCFYVLEEDENAKYWLLKAKECEDISERDVEQVTRFLDRIARDN